MTVWNGRLITDMSTKYIASTLGYLENKAKERCSGSNWVNFVDTAYFDLKEELARREALLDSQFAQK